jgi:hypothetical protein
MAIPVEFSWREAQAFLRGPIGRNTFRFATSGIVRNALQYQGLLVDFPAPQDNAVDDFGIQQGGGFTVEIADESDESDWLLLTEDGSFFLLEDGSGRIILENT